MRDKLELAQRIFYTYRRAPTGTENKRIYGKFLKAYITQCILGGRNDLVLSFGSKHIESRAEITEDWENFICDKCYEIYLKLFTPDDDKTFRKYELIHFGAKAPVHMKVADCPNEWLLGKIVSDFGYEVSGEVILPLKTEYIITKI